MSNIITTDYEAIIGYYDDLKNYLKNEAGEALKREEYEQASDLVAILENLEDFKNSPNLLTIDAHNGMGFTVDEYEQQ